LSAAEPPDTQAPLKDFQGLQDRPDADQSGETFTRAIIFHPDEDEKYLRFIWFKTASTYLG
jgi:hypothetical protein